eukprot:g39244.t1
MKEIMPGQFMLNDSNFQWNILWHTLCLIVWHLLKEAQEGNICQLSDVSGKSNEQIRDHMHRGDVDWLLNFLICLCQSNLIGDR